MKTHNCLSTNIFVLDATIRELKQLGIIKED
jgi:hypothetical protein